MVSKLRDHIKVINSDLSDLTKKQNLDYENASQIHLADLNFIENQIVNGRF
jgi:hypothetical protein